MHALVRPLRAVIAAVVLAAAGVAPAQAMRFDFTQGGYHGAGWTGTLSGSFTTAQEIAAGQTLSFDDTDRSTLGAFSARFDGGFGAPLTFDLANLRTLRCQVLVGTCRFDGSASDPSLLIAFDLPPLANPTPSAMVAYGGGGYIASDGSILAISDYGLKVDQVGDVPEPSTLALLALAMALAALGGRAAAARRTRLPATPGRREAA